MGQPDLMRAFFSAYGIPLPLPEDMRWRLKLYTLLHRFSPVRWYAEERKHLTDLDKFLESLWGSEHPLSREHF